MVEMTFEMKYTKNWKLEKKVIFIELRERTYHTGDFLRIPFDTAPVLCSVRVANTLLSSLMPSIQVVVTARFVDTALAVFAGDAARWEIALPLIGLIVIIAYQYLNGTLMGLANTRMEMTMNEEVRAAMTEKRARLAYAHVENDETWNLISRVCGDPVGRIAGGMGNLLDGMGLIVRVGSLLLILVTRVWWAAMVIAGFSVPLFCLSIRGGRANYQADKEAQKHRRRADYLHGVLLGRDNVEERSLFGYTRTLNEQWYARYEQARNIQWRTQARWFLRMKGASMITLVISLLTVGVLLFPLRSRAISTGIFIGLVNATFSLVQVMSWDLTEITQNLANNREYLKDLTAFCALTEREGALDQPEDADALPLNSVEFRHVTFRYPGTDRDVLQDFSLKLDPRVHYAFVGPNGAGKTTVTKLLTGLYDGYSGDILINGQNLRDIPLARLKGLFSVVYQDFAQYAIPLRDNIALGDIRRFPEAPAQEALETIGLADAVRRLPDGMDTWLGKVREGGMDLSGGEWQKVAIARALVSRAPMRILDEPTASLDPAAESRMYELFGRVSTGVSTILITHRLGAAKLADQIVVIDGGRVVEQGTHHDMLEEGGLNASIFESQRGWYR